VEINYLFDPPFSLMADTEDRRPKADVLFQYVRLTFGLLFFFPSNPSPKCKFLQNSISNFVFRILER